VAAFSEVEGPDVAFLPTIKRWKEGIELNKENVGTFQKQNPTGSKGVREKSVTIMRKRRNPGERVSRENVRV